MGCVRLNSVMARDRQCTLGTPRLGQRQRLFSISLFWGKTLSTLPHHTKTKAVNPARLKFGLDLGPSSDALAYASTKLVDLACFHD